MYTFARNSALAAFICVGTLVSSAAAMDVEPQAFPDGIKVVATASGMVLANAQGLSLYTFDNDTTSSSTCYTLCANTWHAILAAEPALSAPFGVSVRTDGSRQITFHGHPLYHFAGDVAPGDTFGDNLGLVWHLARP
jgi:predicted lipoprotein with Yx(FWY)xxD motif